MNNLGASNGGVFFTNLCVAGQMPNTSTTLEKEVFSMVCFRLKFYHHEMLTIQTNCSQNMYTLDLDVAASNSATHQQMATNG